MARYKEKKGCSFFSEANSSFYRISTFWVFFFSFHEITVRRTTKTTQNKYLKKKKTKYGKFPEWILVGAICQRSRRGQRRVLNMCIIIGGGGRTSTRILYATALCFKKEYGAQSAEPSWWKQGLGNGHSKRFFFFFFFAVGAARPALILL